MPGELHDVVNREEIAGVREPVDEGKLVLQGAAERLGDPLGKVPGGAVPGQVFQMLLRGLARRHGLVRVFVRQLVQPEIDRFGDLDGPGGQRFVPGEEAHHLGRALQMAFRVDVQQAAGALDGRAFPDGREDILQRAACREVVENVVGGDQRQVMAVGEPGQPGEAGAVVAPVEHVRGQVAWPGEAAAQDGKPGGEGLRARAGRGQDDEDLPLGMGAEVLQMEPAPALARALLPQRQQAAKAAVGRPVARVAQQGKAVLEIEAGAGQQADPRLPGGHVGPHDAGQRVPVGDADRRQPQCGRPFHQLPGTGAAPEEAEVGGGLQLGVQGRVTRTGHGGTSAARRRRGGRRGRASSGARRCPRRANSRALPGRGPAPTIPARCARVRRRG